MLHQQSDIRSESAFIWKIILAILLTPITLIQILLKKKEGKEFFTPFTDFFSFITEPKITFTLILLNILIFVGQILLPESSWSGFIMHPSDLWTRPYTIITAGFLHAGITHLLGNMLALFIFGRVVERKLGAGKTALTYFGALIISGIFSSLIHYVILQDNSGGLGASGAIMGIVSAAILLDPFYITYELILPLPVMIVGWLTIWADISGILNPVEDGIGHYAHLGGFLSIALLLYLLGVEDRKKIKKGFLINIVSLIIIGIVYLFFVRKYF